MEKADLQISLLNGGNVPKADSRNVKLSVYLRPGAVIRLSLKSKYMPALLLR
jgi:hypothetical protein